MRAYLDTNILAFVWDGRGGCISRETEALIADYGNTLYTSTICVMELIHLFQVGKLEKKKTRDGESFPRMLFGWLDELGISVVQVTTKHLEKFATLPLYDGHHDPNDRLIIAQAISDKAALVSSDRDFTRYEHCGLEFIFNKR